MKKVYGVQNTTAAPGYSDDLVRECPRCYGDGLTRYNQDGSNDAGEELVCRLCEGHGIIVIENLL